MPNQILKLFWKHNGMKMHCEVGRALQAYCETGSEPVLEIIDYGDHYAILTKSRGGSFGSVIRAGKDKWSKAETRQSDTGIQKTVTPPTITCALGTQAQDTPGPKRSTIMTKEQLQDAIHIAAKGGLSDAVGKAFCFNIYTKAYQPKRTCLSARYSSGEAVICGILLQFHFALHGTPDDLVFPPDRDWQNSPIDLVWPGAWHFLKAADRLTESSSWNAIRLLFPGSSEVI